MSYQTILSRGAENVDDGSSHCLVAFTLSFDTLLLGHLDTLNTATKALSLSLLLLDMYYPKIMYFHKGGCNLCSLCFQPFPLVA